MTDTTPLPKLLPCPFCGGEASIGLTRYSKPLESVRWADDAPVTEAHYGHCIRCSGNHRNSFAGGYRTEAEALTAWNTRANADARLVEALRDCVALLELLYPNPAPNGQISRARAALKEVGQ